MPVIHFTDVAIRVLKEGLYFDEKTPAFGIRVGKHRKTWLVLKEPNRTKLRLGYYPTLTLADARRKALIALGSPYVSISAPTFAEARDQFLALDRWKSRSKYEIERTLTRHFNWTRSLEKITHRDVTVVIDAIEAKSEAAHALKDLKTFFSWCVPRFIPHSPCEGIKPPIKYTPRQHTLSEDELKAVWKAAETLGRYGTMVRLLITTGQRWGQINSLRRSWIDGEERLIKFPAEVMKMSRDHVIPYFDLTSSLLEAIPKTGNLLFPARGMDKPATYQGKLKSELDEQSGVTGWTLHDCRRVFASGMAALGVPLTTVERCLAHRSHSFAGIVQVYQLHSWLPEMKLAYASWEKHLAQIFAS